MSESGREAAVSLRKGGALLRGFLPCDDGLVKATQLNKGLRHPGKQNVQPRVYGAQANGTLKARDRFLRPPRSSIDDASSVPCET
jgi:hypothetical protein